MRTLVELVTAANILHITTALLPTPHGTATLLFNSLSSQQQAKVKVGKGV